MNDSDTLPATLSRLPGRTIAGRYRVEDAIGVGGMGVVFRGRQLALQRPVAIKVLKPEFADLDNHALRFRREAKSVARLDHVNCVKLYDYGTTADELHYMVMPLLHGRPLDELVCRGETVAPRCAMRLLAQVLDGLAHAHGRGLIHRDLKPSNLLIEQRGSRFCEGDAVRIVDFGIAKIVDDEGAFQSRVGVLFGTPAYMSPEQAQGNPLDARTDLYAAGLIAFRLLTGTVPHRARSVVDQIMRRVALDTPRLPEHAPVAVAEIVAKLCARDPEARYADAKAARAAVRAALHDAPPRHDARWDEPGPPLPQYGERTAGAEDPSGRVVTRALTDHLDDATWTFDAGTAPERSDDAAPSGVSVAARLRSRWPQWLLLALTTGLAGLAAMGPAQRATAHFSNQSVRACSDL